MHKLITWQARLYLQLCVINVVIVIEISVFANFFPSTVAVELKYWNFECLIINFFSHQLVHVKPNQAYKEHASPILNAPKKEVPQMEIVHKGLVVAVFSSK